MPTPCVAGMGKPIPKKPHQIRLWEDISTRAGLNEARRRARPDPRQGQFIAAIEIPGDGRITYERMGTDEDHYTLWGDPNTRRRYVVALVPVWIAEEE